MRVISSSHYQPSVTRGLVFHELDETTLAAALATATHMIQSASRLESRSWPRLMSFRITKPAICLGCFQSPHRALSSTAIQTFPVFSRLTGGPAYWIAPGTLYFCAILPNWQIYINPLLPLTPTRVLYKALSDAFRNAFKFKGLILSENTNLVYTRQGQEIARMSMNFISNVLVGEWFFATEKPLELPSTLNGYTLERQEPHPPSGCLRDLALPPPDFFDAEFASAFADALLDTNARHVQSGELTYLDRVRIETLALRMHAQEPVQSEDVTLYSSLLHEEAIGFVHAQVAFNQRLQFSLVRLGGDFIADSPGIELLEKRLRLVDANKRSVALTIDEVLGAPEHFILGVKKLSTLLDAILDAASRNDAWHVTQP